MNSRDVPIGDVLRAAEIVLRAFVTRVPPTKHERLRLATISPVFVRRKPTDRKASEA